jgi:hypothetical protein
MASYEVEILFDDGSSYKIELRGDKKRAENDALTLARRSGIIAAVKKIITQKRIIK